MSDNRLKKDPKPIIHIQIINNRMIHYLNTLFYHLPQFQTFSMELYNY